MRESQKAKAQEVAKSSVAPGFAAGKGAKPRLARLKYASFDVACHKFEPSSPSLSLIACLWDPVVSLLRDCCGR